MNPDIFPRLLLSCALCCAPIATLSQNMSAPQPPQEQPTYPMSEQQERHPNMPKTVVLSDDTAWGALYDPKAGGLTIRATGDPSDVQTIPLKAPAPLPLTARLSMSPSRHSFVLVPDRQTALFEVFYGSNPPQFGFAHDWRIEGPVAQPQKFPVRKVSLQAPLQDLFLDPSGEFVLGQDMAGDIRVTDLVIGQQVAQISLPGIPRFPERTQVKTRSGPAFVFAHQDTPGLSLIEAHSWSYRSIGPKQAHIRHLAGHPETPWLWALTNEAERPAFLMRIEVNYGAILQTISLPLATAATSLTYSPDGGTVLLQFAQADQAALLFPADGHSAPITLISEDLETLLQNWRSFGIGR